MAVGSDLHLMPIRAPDGLYRVVRRTFVAGYVVKDNRVIACAPILCKNITYWLRVSQRIGP